MGRDLEKAKKALRETKTGCPLLLTSTQLFTICQTKIVQHSGDNYHEICCKKKQANNYTNLFIASWDLPWQKLPSNIITVEPPLADTSHKRTPLVGGTRTCS